MVILGAFLVNTARGGLVEEAALASALKVDKYELLYIICREMDLRWKGLKNVLIKITKSILFTFLNLLYAI